MSFSLLFGLLEVKTTLFFQWLKQVKPCCKWSNHIQSSWWFILMCCFLCWMCSVPYLGWWSTMFKRFSPRGGWTCWTRQPCRDGTSGCRVSAGGRLEYGGQYRFWADVFGRSPVLEMKIWLVVTGTFGWFFKKKWECRHPNWRAPWFFRGVELNHQPEMFGSDGLIWSNHVYSNMTNSEGWKGGVQSWVGPVQICMGGICSCWILAFGGSDKSRWTCRTFINTFTVKPRRDWNTSSNSKLSFEPTSHITTVTLDSIWIPFPHKAMTSVESEDLLPSSQL